jgi:predicted oxidoreductase
MGATYRADTVIVGAGLLVVDSPEQRRTRIRDTPERALEDWLTYGELDSTDEWPCRWAEAYVQGSRELIYDWLREQGVRFLPVVHWTERGGDVPGNSVPRFHPVWGTGQRVIDVLMARIDAHPNKDRLLVLARHRAVELVEEAGRIIGIEGEVLGAVTAAEAAEVTGAFRAEGGAVVVAAGGACGDLARVRARWPSGYGTPPPELLNGSHPAAHLTHLERVSFCAAGVRHWKPTHPDHALALVPPRSALWVNSQ